MAADWSQQRRRVTLRTLHTMLLLLEEDLSQREIIAGVSEALGPDVYGTQPVYGFRRDLECLRDAGLLLSFRRSTGRYHVRRFPLRLDLTPAELTTLAIIRSAFGPSVPHTESVHQLLDKFEELLPPPSRHLARTAATIGMELIALDDLTPHQPTITVLERALASHQRAEFVYLAPAKGPERRLTVEPLDLRLQEGHLYLLAYSVTDNRNRNYRVDRIRPGTARVLPTVVPGGGRPRRQYTLCYRVSPHLARYGISPRFPHQQLEPAPDGSVVVTARTESLWWAVRGLLRYGEHIEVLEPEALRQEMARVAREMAAVYASAEPPMPMIGEPRAEEDQYAAP